MSSFTEQVNANIPQQKTPFDIRKEQEAAIARDVQSIAEYIRKRILDAAKYHNAPGPFVFRGYLKYNDLSGLLFTAEEKQRRGLLESHTERSYQLNEYGRLFCVLLRQELQRDGIQVSDWMMFFAICHDDNQDYIFYNKNNREKSSGSFTFLKPAPSDFRSDPCLLEAPIIYHFTGGDTFWDCDWCRYQNKKGHRAHVCACIQIDYRNQ